MNYSIGERFIIKYFKNPRDPRITLGSFGPNGDSKYPIRIIGEISNLHIVLCQFDPFLTPLNSYDLVSWKANNKPFKTVSNIEAYIGSPANWITIPIFESAIINTHK